ncbi:hypothetical protein WOSG25_090410 [Weissella oryzae SG25]|uniref:Uncharacterized protein n=1 Tax=Weissella oryzae (strain DSM 25784 / JCM 18191 / LMG 30913 / SG25) TaxID=1329250 RepID=A0A069CV63_WEIOS|nr:ArdC-like ssDNA-binding domain-containing protein [Weissella oryzae]GAK31344.1 hypothetical protein WOSG25_090410 [Weissella oryzae SG25]
MSKTDEFNEKFADLIEVFDYYKTLDSSTLVPNEYRPDLLDDLMLLADNQADPLQNEAQNFIQDNLKPNNAHSEFTFIYQQGNLYTTVISDFISESQSNDFALFAGAVLNATGELPYDEIYEQERNFIKISPKELPLDEMKNLLKQMAAMQQGNPLDNLKITEFIQHKLKKAEKNNSKNELSNLIKAKDYKGVSATLKNGIHDYLQSDTFKKYLQFISKFHKYSSNNNRLILGQNPGATHVASFNKWKELDRKVVKGSKAIYVYAPMQVVKKDENNKPIVDKNGEIQKETFFKLVPVFDVSQTNGKELPKQVYELPGDINEPEKFKQYFDTLASQTSAKVRIQTNEVLGTSEGFYKPSDNLIVIKKGMGQEQTIKTLIHEIVHAELHTNSQAVFGSREYSQHEFEAESVAFIVADHLGIDTSEYSFGYLSSWTSGGLEIDSFQSSLEAITNEAKTLITKIDATLEKTMTKDKTENLFEERVNKAQSEIKLAAVSDEKQQEKASPKV